MASVSPFPPRTATSPTGPAGPPPWAVRLVEGGASERLASGVTLRSSRDGRLAVAGVTVANAAELPADRFREATVDAYERLHRALETLPARHLVRVWNFIPGILEPVGNLPQRYMAFNAGRFEAYSTWYSGDGAFESRIATASGVGHDGRDLEIHALAAAAPGEPVENPRQVPSYRYSSHYGPRPPCFSRATLAAIPEDGSTWLLVGGTASICGEETCFHDDLAAQLDETLRNLAALVRHGLRLEERTTPADGPLTCFRHLRVYHVRTEDERWVHDELTSRFPALEHLELHRADLCRSGLLVEIEGVATLG